MTNNLETLGEELRLTDQNIIDLAFKRMQIAKKIGSIKYLNGDQISRPAIENIRINNIKQYAESIGLNPNFAATILYSLINESCKEQMIQWQNEDLSKKNKSSLE